MDVLLGFYSFVADVEGVKNSHFIVRDRVDDDVVYGFRFLVEKNLMKVAKSKIRYKLNRLVTKDNFTADPGKDNLLFMYAEWPWKEMVKEHGMEKFTMLCELLSRLSRIIIEMAQKKYFSSEERVEIARHDFDDEAESLLWKCYLMGWMRL